MTSAARGTARSAAKRLFLTELVVALSKSCFPPPVLELFQSGRLRREVQRLM